MDRIDDILSLDDFTKDNVGTVKPLGRNESEEELRLIGVCSCVGHRKEVRLIVFEIKVLISKLEPINRLTTGSIAICYVPSLCHEVGNDSVEVAPFVS